VIVGLGVDLVEVSRIRRALKSPRFIERILTESERLEPLSAERIAGRWAAKEAVAKAVGVFLRWHDVEIHNLTSGAPVAKGCSLKRTCRGRQMSRVSSKRQSQRSADWIAHSTMQVLKVTGLPSLNRLKRIGIELLTSISKAHGFA